MCWSVPTHHVNPLRQPQGSSRPQAVASVSRKPPSARLRPLRCTLFGHGAHCTRGVKLSAHLSAFLPRVSLLCFPVHIFSFFPTLFFPPPYSFEFFSCSPLVHRLPFSSWSLPSRPPLNFYPFLFSLSLLHYFSCL